MNKKIYVVERTTKPLPDTYCHFVRASDIGKAHQFGRGLLGYGVSFKTREPNAIEKQIMHVHTIHEAG